MAFFGGRKGDHKLGALVHAIARDGVIISSLGMPGTDLASTSINIAVLSGGALSGEDTAALGGLGKSGWRTFEASNQGNCEPKMKCFSGLGQHVNHNQPSFVLTYCRAWNGWVGSRVAATMKQLSLQVNSKHF